MTLEGNAPHRGRNRGPLRTVNTGLDRGAVLNWERFTPPCVDCKLPLLKTDKACPRCGRRRDAA